MDEARENEIRAAFEAWDPIKPGAETATELAERFGLTREELYQLKLTWS